ncbi:hypothetical protein [Filifactor alocis]|uniref:hypothetical protein n=1 Tax=Filifactor alocis TaxID=143361 RepID=UPI003F9F658D
MKFNEALKEKHGCEITSKLMAETFEDMTRGIALLSLYGIIQPKDEEKYLRQLETLALSDYAEKIEK